MLVLNDPVLSLHCCKKMVAEQEDDPGSTVESRSSMHYDLHPTHPSKRFALPPAEELMSPPVSVATRSRAERTALSPAL
jgi:hypothetical protein